MPGSNKLISKVPGRQDAGGGTPMHPVTQSGHPGSGKEQLWETIVPLPVGTGALFHHLPPQGLGAGSPPHTQEGVSPPQTPGPGLGVGTALNQTRLS